MRLRPGSNGLAMPDYTTGNIFDSRCQAIVNPVNCVGVMGAGLALQFKQRFPENFAAYADACRAGALAPGRMHVFDTGAEQPRFIINFPTKRHWRDPSRIEDIALGIDALNAAIAEHGIQSVAIPPLGAGLGGLPWPDVRRLIADRLADRGNLDIAVYEPVRTIENTATSSAMNPELHAFFLNPAAVGHNTHADLALSYRDLCNAADSNLDLLPHVEAFEDFREDVRYARDNPDPDADPAYAERLEQLASALTRLDTRRIQISDFVIEVSQAHRQLEALTAEATEGRHPLVDHPDFSAWLYIRHETLQLLEEYRASPELRPHLDFVLGIDDDDTITKLDAITASASTSEEPTAVASVTAAAPPAPDLTATAPASEASTPVWAGVGARKTPPSVLADMTALSRSLAENGWRLSSGGAHGADSAFAAGIPADQRTLWLPWPGYNELSGPDCRIPTRERMQDCLAIAERLHPAWHKCSQGARKLHARNVAILLGPELDRPVDAVVCWTEGGAVAGGTGMALRIAAERGIPVFNLGSMTVQAAREQLEQIRHALGPTDARTAAPPTHRTGLDPESRARVVHIRNAPPDAIRIDRKTQWGNPFIIGRDGTRDEVIAKHREDLWKRIHAGTVDLAELASLHGKTLACHCAPQPCHGDTLAEAAAWAVANRHQTTATDRDRAAVSSQDPISQDAASRTYVARDACVFRFTKADWGLFSNFAQLPNPISAADGNWPTSEHLYQAAKFRLSPDVQQQIAQATLPRDAAKLGRDRANKPDADWMSRRTDAMRWVIRMKREANPELVDAALERTGDRPIVEYSGHDAFWGARPDGANLVGSNVLGRLWMELRQQIRDGDPRAQASAWDNPLTPAAVASADPARDERSHINRTYRALLTASGNDPQLIPYQDTFHDFRATVAGAIDADRQPPPYMEKLRELDRRLQTDMERKETLASIQAETTDLNAQLSWLTRAASAAGAGSIANLPEYPAFVQDTASCLERWTAFQADPEARAHIEHLNDPVLDTRVYLLSGHVPAPEPAMTSGPADHPEVSSPSQHPIVREYVELLERAGNKPELLVYQPEFHDFRETVRLARDDPSQHPDMAEALGRLSAKLEESHEARVTVAGLRRRLTESADEARDIENWAAGQGGRTIQDSPRYDAWRKNADALVDEYRSMTRDSRLAPHVNDRDEARQFLQRRIAFLSEDRFARTPALSASEEEALHLARHQEAESGLSMSM